MQEKLFYKISEVCEQTGLEAYVIRFWETEFPTLHPKKSQGNQRIYTRKEIDHVFEIKRLLYGEGLTIAGARKRLREPGQKQQKTHLAQTLSTVKKELEALLHLLN